MSSLDHGSSERCVGSLFSFFILQQYAACSCYFFFLEMFLSFEISDEKVGDDFLVMSIISLAISLGAQLTMFGDTLE